MRRGRGSKAITTEYSAFKVLNLATGKLTEYPYTKGLHNRDCEDKAFRDQMELTGQPRHDFIVHGLVKRT